MIAHIILHANIHLLVGMITAKSLSREPQQLLVPTEEKSFAIASRRAPGSAGPGGDYDDVMGKSPVVHASVTRVQCQWQDEATMSEQDKLLGGKFHASVVYSRCRDPVKNILSVCLLIFTSLSLSYAHVRHKPPPSLLHVSHSPGRTSTSSTLPAAPLHYNRRGRSNIAYHCL